MKVTDYIVECLIAEGVTDIFGYPGGVICHFMDSITKYDKISAHINYHEQAAAFAACGYAQESTNLGVAYSTSGPGATNLVTGIANAYFDSIPVLFLTGQVDTYALKGNLPIRQRGFQETDIVSMVKDITKYAVRVDNPTDIVYELTKAISIARSGNPGPVLLDLPADVQRAEIDKNALEVYESATVNYDSENNAKIIAKYIKNAKRPCLLVGNGIKQAGCREIVKAFIEKYEIPTVFSMPAFDTLPYDSEYNYGFIGANGHRYGNFVLAKSDLVITFGSRMDLKQVGNNRAEFISDTQIIRVDIDENSFMNPVHDNDIQLTDDVKTLLPILYNELHGYVCTKEWNITCKKIEQELKKYDEESLELLKSFGNGIETDCRITLDVGQSQVWGARYISVKNNQSVHMSAGLGSMGYSLPAAIGTYYASRVPVYSFNGDGGVQMNIQELQFLDREDIPVHVVIINNHSLGMIRGFQEANFNKNYYQTTEGTGYSSPNYAKIATAYNLQYFLIKNDSDITNLNLDELRPSIIEIVLPSDITLAPNFGRNGLIQDQRPYIERELFERLMNL